ncbi:MAG: hypothetical protein HUU06_01330 [Planctomycetaceae bacterium]|nr:hypothetical protein [Planctomycetota bacterium]NUN51415.1 hypothetical protein [Planctomycetaceae bacterium]
MPLSHGIPGDLQREVSGEAFQSFFEQSLRCDEGLAPFPTSAALLEFLHAPSEEYARKDAALCALLRTFQAGGPQRPGVGALLLLALWPGLAAIARSKRGPAREPEELWAEVYWAFLETAWRFPVARRTSRVAQNLKLDTLHRLGDVEADRAKEQQAVAGLLRAAERTGEVAVSSSSLDPAALAEEAETAARRGAFAQALARACERAVAEGLISDLDRHLIVATRLYGQNLKALAELRGVAYEMAKKRRQRAEAVLRRLLGPQVEP